MSIIFSAFDCFLVYYVKQFNQLNTEKGQKYL